MRAGFARILQIVASLLVIVSLLIFITPLGRGVYAFYQQLSYRLGVNLNNIASNNYENWIAAQSTDFVKDQKAIFLNDEVASGPEIIDNSKVLGQSLGANDNRWIEINLSEQRLYMKEDGKTVGSFLISSGKWAPTPTGEFRIWIKLRYTKMVGGSKALGTYYDLPNVPYTMYFYKGYGIHGAYWHNNFGHPMSHGCINMRPDESAIVYNWADVGTRVVIHN